MVRNAGGLPPSCSLIVLRGGSTFAGGADTMKLRSFALAGAVVASVVLAGWSTRADAAAVASTTASSVITDKIRCGVTYTSTGTNTWGVKWRCYFDSSRTGWVARAGTDLSVTLNSSPVYLLLPTGANCSGSGTFSVAVGPQSASLSLSGQALGSLAFEASGTVTGASCAMAGLSSAVGTARLNYTGSTNPDQGQCVVGGCVAGVSAGWPAWPSDWYTGGSVSGIPPFCGATVTVTGRAPTDRLVQGDTPSVSVAWTSGQTGTVQMIIPGNIPRSQTLYVPGTISNPAVSSVRVNVEPTVFAAGPRWSDVTLQCYDAMLAQTFQVKVGQALDQQNDGRPRPCDLAQWYWPPQQSVAVGDSLSWSLSYSGTPQTGLSSTAITVQWAAYDEAAATPSRPENGTWLAGLTWTTLASSVPLGTSADYPITAPYAGSLRQFFFRCTDALGTTYGRQWLSAVRTSVPLADEGEAACFRETGLGMSPSSWVPGLLRGGLCILKVSFIPSDGFLAAEFSTDDSEAAFDDTSAFYPITLASSLVSSGADLLVVTDAEVSAGNCGFSVPWSPINSTGSGPGGSSTTVVGMSSSSLSFNTCSDSGMRTVVQAVRYLGLVGSVFGFVLFAYRWASRLSMGNGEK